MARKRRGEPVDGWINLDKPEGVSSARAVAIVRRLFDAAKVGHGGTLDPLASGVLPVALGEATKTVHWAMTGAKAYSFALRFGVATATDDREGEVVATSDARPSDFAIRAALPLFVGTILQRPPAYSALKVDGRRAYALARAGEAVELEPRPARVDGFELVGRPDADTAHFAVRCGKGVYIRSLARDLARAVGTVGHVAALRRTACGPFEEKAAISLANLEALGHKAARLGHLLPVATALDDIPALALTESMARRLQSGQAIPMSEAAPTGAASAAQAPDDRPTPSPPSLSEESVAQAYCGSRLVAIVRREGDLLRSTRVFNLAD